MCTAISYLQNHHFFGRTLDFERSFGEQVVITPRRYPLHFTNGSGVTEHYAIIGMATVREGYPLYFDATNEKGVSMAGLLFAGNAVYHDPKKDCENMASYECILRVLSKCSSVQEARILLERVNITNASFSVDLPPTPLHWIIADREECIVLESVQDGVKIYENPIGVLTNNPPFSYHMLHLTDFMQLTDRPPQNNLYSEIALQPYSRGMGAIGLPGDSSSASRFIRAAFTKAHSTCGKTREEEIMQHFHVLRSVEMVKGCITLPSGDSPFTVYTSCCDTEKGVYYYTTYENSTMYAIDMYAEDLTSTDLVWYSLKK